MGVTKPYEFVGFRAMDVTKPHEFICFGGGYCSGGGLGPGLTLDPGSAREAVRPGLGFDRVPGLPGSQLHPDPGCIHLSF